MPKRLRDTEIWNKVWFRKLKPKYKCFITYLFDKCDHAGIWEVDKDLMEFYIHDRFKESLDDLLIVFSNHIVKISNTKWFLIDFIPFQYKCKIENLNPKSKIHKSVIDILTKYNVLNMLKKPKKDKSKGLAKPLQRVKDKDKDKDPVKDLDKVKDKDKDKDKDRKDHLQFEKIWEKYPNKVGKKQAIIHYRVSVKTEKDWEDINKALDNYIETEKVKKGFIQNGSTWFNNWRDYINYKEPEKRTGKLTAEDL